MTKKEILQEAGTKKYWILEQCSMKGVIGEVQKDASGRCDYTAENLVLFKKYLKAKGMVK